MDSAAAPPPPVSSGSASALAPAHTHHPPSAAPPPADEPQWSTKDILWHAQPAKIITQNKNGPCSLIALCNILLLQRQIQITPPDRPVVSYSYLSQLIADHLLARSQLHPNADLGAALSILPRTQHGLDVDVRFNAHDAFATSSSGAPELALFQLCGVPLVHGWLADPADKQTYDALVEAGSYNTAVEHVVRGDEIAKGAVVNDRGVGLLAQQLDALSLSKAAAAPANLGGAASVDPSTWSDEQTAHVHRALVLQHFLDSTSSQLTYHGLFVLAQAVQPGQLVALFRNSHVSVLYRRTPDEGGGGDAPALFTLVTDSAFLMEDEIVWESLVDVDGASSQFFDGKLHRASLRSGDFVGGASNGGGGGGGNGVGGASGAQQHSEDADFALAMQIHQRDQDRLEDARRRREMRGGGGGGGAGGGAIRGRGGRPSPNTPGSSYDGHRIDGGPYAQYASSAPIVPTEVFTTMRFDPAAPAAAPPSASASDSPFIDMGGGDGAAAAAAAQGPMTRAQADALVDALLPEDVVRRKKAAKPTTTTTTAAPPPTASTNPFLSAAEQQQPVVAPPTNPFAPALLASASEQKNAAATIDRPPLDATVAAHPLARQIPLLDEHLRRLAESASAMCRIYPQAWSAQLLQQRRVLDASEILASISAALASAPAQPGVRGVRVAVKRDGRIEVHIRPLTPFPSTSSSSSASAAAGGLAGHAPLPAVRLDTEATRVRQRDLEPVVYNKTDARGFYDAAKARVYADAAVLSGVRPEDGRCFDVVLWNDEGDDGGNAEPRVTESSIANVVLFLPLTEGGRYITPPTQLGLLDGLVRRHLVACGAVEEEALPLSLLHHALGGGGGARLYLCNSLRGMFEVELVDGLAVPPVHPGAASLESWQRRKKSTASPSSGPNGSGTGTGGKKRFSTLLLQRKGSGAHPSPGPAVGSQVEAEGGATPGVKPKAKKTKEEKCTVM